MFKVLYKKYILKYKLNGLELNKSKIGSSKNEEWRWHNGNVSARIIE